MRGWTAGALVRWFGERCPDVAGGTVRTQLSEASRAPGRGRQLLERVGRGCVPAGGRWTGRTRRPERKRPSNTP
ncbi:DUF7669 domain-containing protein [Nocardiopsis ganjiahuensis]